MILLQRSPNDSLGFLVIFILKNKEPQKLIFSY